MANDFRIQALIEAKNEAAAALASFQRGLLGVAAAVGAAYAAFRTFEAVLGGALRGAIEQERADLKLAQALATVGQNTESARKHFSDFASSLQDVTAVSDETIQGVLSVLTSIGRLTGEGLERATKAAVDFSAATGKDLEGVALALAKAAAGSTGALARFGIVIDEDTPKAEALALALAHMEKNTGGAAQAIASGLGGQLQRVANNFDDLKQKFGEAIFNTDAFKSVVKLLADELKRLQEWVAENEDSLRDFGIVIGKGALAGAEALTKLAKGVVAVLEAEQLLGAFIDGPGGRQMDEVREDADALRAPLVALDDAIDRLQVELEEMAKAGGGASKETKKVADAIKNVKDQAGGAASPLDALNQAFKDLGLTTLSEFHKQAAEATAASKMLTDALRSGAISGADYDVLSKQLQAAIDKLREAGVEAFSFAERIEIASTELLTVGEELYQVFGISVAGAAADVGVTLVDAAFGADIAWRKFFKQLLRDIAAAIVQALVLRAVLSGFGLFGGGAGGEVTGSPAVRAQGGGEVFGGRRGLDSVRALLMPGEIVLPASLKKDFESLSLIGQALRSGATGGGAGGGAVNAAPISASIRFEQVVNEGRVSEIISAMNDAVERFGYRLVASEVRA